MFKVLYFKSRQGTEYIQNHEKRKEEIQAGINELNQRSEEVKAKAIDLETLPNLKADLQSLQSDLDSLINAFCDYIVTLY